MIQTASNTNAQVVLDHNKAECIKSVWRWGETVYYNICNGKEVHVAWGLGDYLLLIAALGGILFCIVFTICMLTAVSE